MYRNLSNEVKVSDMIGMRDSGMNQREIADALGVCAATVSRYLGKHDRVSKATVINDAPRTQSFGDKCQAVLDGMDKAVKSDTTRVLAEFEIVSSVTTLRGKMCSYIVDSVNGTVELDEGLISGILDSDTIKTFIEELKAIERRLSA